MNYTDKQKEAIELAVKNLSSGVPLTKIGGYAGCYDAETEYLTPQGWKKFSEYVEGDKVAQYLPIENEVIFVDPIEYTKLPETRMTFFKGEGINQCLSDGHRVVYWPSTASKEPRTLPFHEVKKRHNKSKNGWKSKFKTTFQYRGPGINYSEGELRLQIAVMADGRIVKEGKDNYTQMRFTKERKYRRLLDICQTFELRHDDRGVNNEGYFEVIVWPKTNLKKFTAEFYNCSDEQLSIIAEEVPFWDGSVIEGLQYPSVRYFTKNKFDADFVQFAFASQNFNTSIHTDTRQDAPDYTVNAHLRKHAGFRCICNKDKKVEMQEVFPTDGFKYCFTVPSGMLLVRRGNLIVISGNTGKTTIMKEILSRVKNVGVCAYTGKAADVLRRKDVKGATTIHQKIYEWDERRRKFFKVKSIPFKGFAVDEASMVGGGIFPDLKSFKVPILAVGDPGQLEPIGKDINLMKDCDIVLDEIHRQAADNPIIDLATRIRLGQEWGTQDIDGCWVMPGRPRLMDLVDSDIVICGFNKTRVKVNRQFREHLRFDKVLENGDKIIVLANDKDIGVFNGQTATVEKIIKIDGTSITTHLLFDDGRKRTMKVDTRGFNNLNKPKWDFLKTIKGRAVYADYGYAVTCHKCVHPETFVETLDGIQRIRDIPKEGLILSGSEFLPYKNKVQNPPSPCITVRTKDGSEITVTEDHKCEVWDGEQYILTDASNLKLGQFVRKALFSSEYESDVLPHLLEGDIDSRSTPVTLPSKMSKELAEFLGLVVGDGCLFKGGVRLFKRHEDVVERFCELCQILFEVEIYPEAKPNGFQAELHSCIVKDWLYLLGGCYPKYKHTPECILKSSSKIRAKFLKGLFEDGSVNIKDGKFDHIEWSSSSARLRNEVRYLLNSLGMICGTNSQKRNSKSLYLYSDSARLFRDSVGFVSKFKNSRLENIESLNTRDLVPVSTAQIEKLKEFLTTSDYGNVKSRGYITRNKLKGAISNGLKTDLLDWQHSRIVSLEGTESTTVCVEVPANNRFNQNGFWWGNCQGSEYDHVTVISEQCDLWDEARWTYTAVTRAAETLTLWTG